jgi:hypothetical protein
VDLSRIPEDTQAGPFFALGRDAYQANRQTGERMVADEVEWLGKKARELLEEYDRLLPVHGLTTFEEVEAVWQDVILPDLSEYESMKDIWDWQKPIPESSPWFANMKIPSNWR